MANRDPDNHTGRSVALVGGGALLFWLLFRGRGWGLGGNGAGTGAAGTGAAGTTAAADSEARPRCQVFIRAHQIDLDGVPTDLPAVVARCRASGGADVRATGGASVQAVEDVLRALRAAGVSVAFSESVSKPIKAPAARNP